MENRESGLGVPASDHRGAESDEEEDEEEAASANGEGRTREEPVAA